MADPARPRKQNPGSGCPGEPKPQLQRERMREGIRRYHQQVRQVMQGQGTLVLLTDGEADRV